MVVGVLAFQGDFAEHIKILDDLKVRSVEVRSSRELSEVDVLIIPGGESTVMMKFLTETGLDKEIIKRVKSEMPVLGTCAGAILLSDSYLNLLGISVDRNAYGSQLQSFSDRITIKDIGSIEAAFIRAPIITRVGDDVSVLASYNENPVLVQSGLIIAATFHPEVKSESAVHSLLLRSLSSLKVT